MNKLTRGVFSYLLAMTLVLFFGSSTFAASNSAAKVVLDLDSATSGIQATIRANVDEEVGIDVIAQDAVTLKSWSFKMNFDPAELELVEGGAKTYEGDFVKNSVSQTFFLTDFTDKANGNLAFDLSSFGGTPPTGTGIIVHVTFKVLDTGPTQISLSDVKFFDENDAEDNITANSTGGLINPPFGISGQVTGGTGGTVYVVALTDILVLPPVAETVTDANGNFLLSGFANGDYYLFAFRDVDGDESPNYGEYQGFYGAPTQVTFSGSDVENIDITLVDTTNQGPIIDEAYVYRDLLPNGTGPTGAGGLHGYFELDILGGTPNWIIVEFPDESTPIEFSSVQPDYEGYYVHTEPLTSIPQGTYAFTVMASNYMVDVEHIELTTDVSAMPSPPTLTGPADGAKVQASDSTSWPLFSWTGGVEGNDQEVTLASNASMTQEFFYYEVYTGTYQMQSGDVALSDGTTYYWNAGVSDDSGENFAYSAVRSFTVDNTTPTTTADRADGYLANADFLVTLTANKPANITYTTDGSDPKTSGTATTAASPVTIPITTEGLHTIQFFATDSAGNEEDTKTLQVALDKTTATTAATPNPGSYNTDFNVTLTADEPANITYTTDGSDPKTSGTATTAASPVTIPITTEGSYTIQFFATDSAGNEEDTKTLQVALDKTAATTTATPDSGFYNTDFNVILTASETANITYTTDGSDPKTSGTATTTASPVTIPITTEGSYTIQFFATDSAGNEEDTKTLQVALDKTLPVTTASLAEGTYGTAKDVTLSATDVNLDATYFDLLTSDPGATPSPPTTPYTDAINLAVSGEVIDYWLVYYSIDKAENAEDVKVAKYTIDTRVPETTVTFDPQPNQYDTAYYSNNQAGLTITLASQGNTIYYTTDGSEPTESSPSAQDSVPLPFNTEGIHTVRYFAKNPQALTEEKRTLVLVLDFTAPATPILDPAPTSPTNVTTQAIGGTKDADTAIYLQGVVDPVVPLNDLTTWSYDYPLQEGSNQFALVARDPAGNESAPTAQTTIVLDTVRPYTDGHDPVRNTTVPQPLNKQVIVHVKDDGVGVEQSSIILTVAGVQYLYDNKDISINAANVNDMVVTFKPPENYSADTNVSVKVEAQDLAGNAMAPDVYAFLTGSNVGITPAAIGLAVDDTFTFTATGGSTPYTWSRSPEANSSISNITETTADFSASAVGPYTVTVTDAANDEASATVDVVTSITISTTPANDALESGGEFTFAASGGKVDGEVVWEVDQGSIDPASGLYTVTTADTIQVTVTAYDATYNKSHVSPVKGSYAFTVYPEVALTGIPDTAPTVQPGETYDVTLTPSGGSGDYEWMVTTDPSGTFGDWVEQPTFDFVAPDTGPFAGPYEITLRDKNNPDFTATFQIKVPLVFEPETKNIKGGDSFDLVLKGADANATADYEFTEDASADTYTTLDPDPATFAEVANEPTTATTEVTADTVNELKKFKIKATVTGDDDLEAAGLNIASTGWIRVLPTVEFSGVIEEAQGGPPIPGATIMFKLAGKTVAMATSAADGSFTVSLLDPSMMGAQYEVVVLAANYIASLTTTAGWESPQTIELTPEEDFVSGTVTDGVNPIEGARIECLVNDEPIVTYSDAVGNYTIGLPVLKDALAGELVARAVKEGYVASRQNVLVDPDFTLAAQADPGDPQNVCEEGGSFTDGECTVEIPADTLTGCHDLNIDPNVDVGTKSVYTEHSSVLVEIDLGGAVLAEPIEICIPFDTADLNPGDFKGGIAFIYHAPTTVDLQNRTNVQAVPTSDIIYEDHLKPEVCFNVGDLSTFGAGSSSGAAAADGGGGGGGGCFIATAASGPGAVKALVVVLILALLSITGVMILRRLPRR